MLSRIATSFTLALLGVYGLTAPAFANKGPDADNVMLGTAATAAILMAIVGVLYAAKWALGLAEPAPPPPPADDAHGGHH